MRSYFILVIFHAVFLIFFQVGRTLDWIPPVVTSENTGSITKEKQKQNPTTLTLVCWVFHLICSILWECWRKGMVGFKSELIK